MGRNGNVSFNISYFVYNSIMEDKLKEILDYLNDRFNQESDEYNIFEGAKPQVIRYDEHTAISTWACGAIVCINDLLYFLEEDDGNWFMNQDEYNCGYQTTFSIGWAASFINALSKLTEYVQKNGSPIYYSGTNTVCHYTL